MCVCECVLVYVYEREKEKPLSFLLQIACLFRTSQIFTELSCKDFVKLTVKSELKETGPCVTKDSLLMLHTVYQRS